MARPKKDEVLARTEQKRQEKLALTKRSDEFDLPDMALGVLVKKGILTPLMDTQIDLQKLELIKTITRLDDFMRAMLLLYPKAKREKMLSLAPLSPAEKYVMDLYLEGNGRVSKKKIYSGLKKLFDIEETISSRLMVQRMRDRAYSARSRSSRKEQHELSDDVFLE